MNRTTKRRTVKGKAATLGFGLPLLVVVCLGLAAGSLPLVDPNVQDLTKALTPPVWLDGGSWENPLGTDQQGRDMLSRLLYGCRLTILVGVLGMLAGAVPGTILGLIAGYRGGLADLVISRLVEAQLALPFILLAMAIIVARGRSIGVLVIVLALVGWAQYARIVRSDVLSVSQKPFVLGLQAAGLGGWRILLRHILPNVMGTVIVLSTLQLGTIILAESALSFLNLGVVPPAVSWGAMLSDGRELLVDAWWVAALPGFAISVVVLLVNLFGDALRTWLDPKQRTY